MNTNNNYIDLGLPSGTLWADTNEEGFFTFDEAVEKFNGSLPAKQQFEELIKECEWKRDRNGFTVTGPNGKSVILPAEGFRMGTEVYFAGSIGYYCSSTCHSNTYAYILYFYGRNTSALDYFYRDFGKSVRLVKSGN